MTTPEKKSYEALALRWRPQNFNDVLAQTQVTQTLRNAIAAERIHHAYLFCGPRGTGKTTTARILAKALNCEKGPTPDPCDECESCVAIRKGANIDVMEIDAASHTGVDDIRELRDSTMYVPAMSRFKIYIIDEVHRLSPSAKDALLKTLEEPPPTVKFIFATTESHEVPATVRSRALRLDFHLIPHEVLREHLMRMAEADGITLAADAADVLAAEAAGSLRDAQSLLDQVASYADRQIDLAVANEALGLVDIGSLFQFTDAVAGSEPQAALDLIGEVSRAGRSLQQFVQQLNDHIKRLLFARSLKEKFRDDALSADGCARYREAADRFEENDLLRLLAMSVETGQRLRRSPQPRLEMEMFALRATRMEQAIDIRALVAQIEQQGGGADMFARRPNPSPQANPASPTPRSQPPPSFTQTTRPAERPDRPAEPTSQASATSTATAQAVAPPAPAASGSRVDFSPILEAICQERPTMRAVLGHAVLVRTGPGTVELDVYNGSPFHSNQLKQKPIRDLINAEVHRALGEGLRISIHVKSGAPPVPDGTPDRGAAAPTAQKTANGTGVADNHHVQEILRRFEGEIVN